MTRTLTTEQLRARAESLGLDFFIERRAGIWVKEWLNDGCTSATAEEVMMWSMLTNRESQPVALVDRRPAASGSICWQKCGKDLPHGTELFTAPPAPAVTDKPRLPPHVYRDLLDMLQEAAIAYGGTQQLRAQLSSALSIHVPPDHPHTRTAMLAAAPEGGNG